MPKYRVPVVWQSWGVCEVEADTAEEAKNLAIDPKTPLPEAADFVDETAEVDEEAFDIYLIEDGLKYSLSQFTFNFELDYLTGEIPSNEELRRHAINLLETNGGYFDGPFDTEHYSSVIHLDDEQEDGQ
jgi:hypothetical protein